MSIDSKLSGLKTKLVLGGLALATLLSACGPKADYRFDRGDHVYPKRRVLSYSPYIEERTATVTGTDRTVNNWATVPEGVSCEVTKRDLGYDEQKWYRLDCDNDIVGWTRETNLGYVP